ncbi:MAG: hypothetical protein Q7V88_07330 [Actinomycetota bacterium]|nr:hypothetical protein [Actinomycetota bacterium]
MPPGQPGAPPKRRNNTTVLVGALVGVAALIGIGIVVTRDDGSKGATSTSTTRTTLVGSTLPGSTSSYPEGTLDPSTLGAGEVLLEPVNAPMAEPFTPTAGSGNEAAPSISLPELPLPTTTATMPVGQVALPQIAGNQPGLYGGTRNAAACDPQAMINYLEQNPDKAAAWAGVQGITVSEIREYIEGLTPVVLTRDTRVTNHGFRNGQAFAHPSVLQAGHAVLVDRWGVPRAKCSCGNPLTPPVPLTTPPTYVGPQWPGFTTTTIIVIIAIDPVDEGFILIDLTSGDMIVRPVGADPDTPDLATGDVRVTLRWSDAADLDLAVTDPMGETVSYDNASVSSGGALDVDANANCNEAQPAPAENIVWGDTAPDGLYTIVVDLYSSCTAGDSHAFELTALVGGVPVQLYLGGEDGALTPTGNGGTVSSGTSTLLFAFAVGDTSVLPTTPGGDPGGDPGTGTDAWEDASLTILDQLLLDCGVFVEFTSMGEVEGGWRWIASNEGGDADFTVMDPTGNWYVQPNNQLAADMAVSCGFYQP